MRTWKESSRIPIAIAALATIASAAARGEYRCATPAQLQPAEQRACGLARQGTPDALIHFVNRTKAIYGLYVNDYVSEADVDRWERARERAEPGSPAVAKAVGATKGDGGTD